MNMEIVNISNAVILKLNVILLVILWSMSNKK